MNHNVDEPENKWWRRIRLVVFGYRILAFAIGIVQVFAAPSVYSRVIPPLVLLLGIGFYTLVTAFYAFRWYMGGAVSYAMLGIDMAVGFLLLMSTGGLHSPFLLFTLAPVVTAALFQEIRVAVVVAGLSAAYTIGCQLCNPFSPNQLSGPDLSLFLVYMTAGFLVAALPYLVNINLRQRLQYVDIIRERQRLSREIHDGAAQTVSALRWQVQLLYRRLAEKGVDLNEARELDKLAEKAQQETRESLELLRSYTGDGSLLPHLKGYLEYLKQESSIDFRLDAERDEFHLQPVVEFELLRICQEALANARRHSGARNVQVTIKSVDSHLKVSIADDGSGFVPPPYDQEGAQSKGHGLEVMRERALSVGGKFQVFSSPGQGTVVRVEVPMNGFRRGALWEMR